MSGDVFAAIDPGLSLALFVVNLLLIGRAWLASRASRAPLAGTPQDVSIVIPLKGWDEGLPDLIRGLLASETAVDFEVLLVIDPDHPRAHELPVHERFRPIHPEPLPSGWRDKNWRLAQGQAQARHEAILFLDSDVSVEPGTLDRRLRDHAGIFSFAIPVYGSPGTQAERLLASFTSYSNFFLYRAGVACGVRETAIGPSMLFTAGRGRLAEALSHVRGALADDHALGHYFGTRGELVHCAREPVFVLKHGEGFGEVTSQILRWLMLPRTVAHLLTLRLVAVLLVGSLLNSAAGLVTYAGLAWSLLDPSPAGYGLLIFGVFLLFEEALALIVVERAYARGRFPKPAWRHLLWVPVTLLVQPYLLAAASLRRRIPWRGALIPANKDSAGES
jgi:hypothetical protein